MLDYRYVPLCLVLRDWEHSPQASTEYLNTSEQSLESFIIPASS